MGEYPDDLKLSTWEKKKGSLPPKNELADKLKALQKKHEAVDWKLFDPAWAKKASSVDELDQAFAARDKTYRSSVLALKKDANDAVAAAQLMGRAKDAAKPTLDAVKAVVAAANRYGKAIDAGVEELQQARDAARAPLAEAATAKDDAPDSALLDPKKLLAQLQQCLRNPEYRAQFGFVDAKEKQPPALAMHPKTAGRSLFAKLQEALQVKAGAYGTAWIADKTLNLQVDKAFSGLVKKVRIPIKACGFRIAKIVLWTADGELLEQDADDVDTVAEPGGADGQDLARQHKLGVKAYLETLPADIRTLASSNPEAAARLSALLKQAVALAQSGALADAFAALDAMAGELAQAQGKARSTEASKEIPKGKVAEQVRELELATVDWQIRRMRSVDGLAELAATLLTHEDPDLLEIASRVATLATRIPDALEARVEALRAAVEAGDGAGVKAAKDGVAGELRVAATFLSDDAVNLRNCEDNPFGIGVRIVAPLAEAIKTIQLAMARV